jgi:hypothetical protein
LFSYAQFPPDGIGERVSQTSGKKVKVLFSVAKNELNYIKFFLKNVNNLQFSARRFWKLALTKFILRVLQA